MSFALICLILGYDHDRTFTIEIEKTEKVDILKKLIKVEMSPRFDDIAASDLELWKVIIPIDNLETDLRNLSLTRYPRLFPSNKKLTRFFEDVDVTEDYLHVIVKVPEEVQPVVALNSSQLLLLNCLILGDDWSKMFTVDIPNTKNVSNLKKVIKVEVSPRFDHISAPDLKLWKVFVPCSPNVKGDVEKLNLVNDDSLQPHYILSNLFSSIQVTDHIHVVINQPLSSTELDVSVIHPAEKAHQRTILDARNALSPSTVSGSALNFKSEQDKSPIYNGRPANLKGPPLSIYHSAFAEIGDALQNLDMMNNGHGENRVKNVAKLCQTATNIYKNEAERIKAVYPLIETLMGIKITRNDNIMQAGQKATEIDGLVQQCMEHGDKKAIVARVELKNELGLSGQSTLQNDLSLRKHLTGPQYYEIRNTTCCPCITISIAGPYISFGGAIYTDIFVAEQFTDFIYLGGTREKILTLSRIFAAVAHGIEKLKGYYYFLELRPLDQPNLARLFPHPSYLPGPGKRPSSTLVFSGRFDYKGREAGDYRRSNFEATYNNATVLVKFCESYHGKAHSTLAKAKYAPTLIFCEKLKGGMMMIIMELVNGKNAFHHFLGDLPDDILDQVKSAVGMLHDQNLVFGDLRRPNIMIKEMENKELRALLIGFDWVGTADQARYPPFLIDSGMLTLADGARPHGLMRKAHDLAMIPLLNFPIKLNYNI